MFERKNAGRIKNREKETEEKERVFGSNEIEKERISFNVSRVIVRSRADGRFFSKIGGIVMRETWNPSDIWIRISAR